MTRHSFLFSVAALISFASASVHAADAPDLLDPKKILESLPRDLVKDMTGKAEKVAPAIQEANKKLAAAHNGKQGTMSFKATRVVEYQGAFNVYSEAERVRVAGVEFAIYYELHLAASENAKASSLRPGSKVAGGGMPYVSISSFNGLHLIIMMRGATLK